MLLRFGRAFRDCFDLVEDLALRSTKVLEIGGGAHPSILNRTQLEYTVVDIDSNELKKGPADIRKEYQSIENFRSDQKYDLIISKMVLEHVEFPDVFHTAVRKLLAKNGQVVHFYACKYSFASTINRILPDRWSAFLLFIISNRDLVDNPKYKAYYNKVGTSYSRQKKYYFDLGYDLKVFNLYVGHTYLQNVPVLREMEKIFSAFLYFFNLRFFSSVAIIVLEKLDE